MIEVFESAELFFSSAIGRPAGLSEEVRAYVVCLAACRASLACEVDPFDVISGDVERRGVPYCLAGDSLLVTSGMFPESLSSRGMGIAYVAAVGSEAYRRAMTSRWPGPPARVLASLSAEFMHARDALEAARDECERVGIAHWLASPSVAETNVVHSAAIPRLAVRLLGMPRRRGP